MENYATPYKSLNCGIPRDRTQHGLLRAEALSISQFVKHVRAHCTDNNLEHDEPKSIADAITMIDKIYQQNPPDFNIILLCLLTRDSHKSTGSNKIMKVNIFLKNSVRKNQTCIILSKIEIGFTKISNSIPRYFMKIIHIYIYLNPEM